MKSVVQLQKENMMSNFILDFTITFVEIDGERLRSNLYLVAKLPIEGLVHVDDQPSNAFFGSSQIFEPIYEKTVVNVGDEIRVLHGGILIQRGDKWKRFRTEPYRFPPFEKNYGGQPITLKLSSDQVEITKREN